MKLFKRKTKNKNKPNPKWKIEKNCLDLILECSKDNYPKEFGGLLKVDADAEHTISEIILLPGTISGGSHAIFKMHMRPIDFTLVGTVHSHPSPSNNPSQRDLELFSKYGKIHIITAHPFNSSSWKGYNYNGSSVEIEVIKR